MVAPLIILAIILLATPPVADTVFQERITADNSQLVLGIKHLGATMIGRSDTEKYEERVQELRNAKTEEGIIRGTKNLNAITDSQRLLRRTQVLNELLLKAQNDSNTQRVTALQNAINAPFNNQSHPKNIKDELFGVIKGATSQKG